MNVFMRCAASLLAASMTLCAVAQSHPFSVEDDIAMVHFSDPSAQSGVPGSNMIKASPDHTRYALVTTRGLLKQNRIESDIVIFQRADLEKYIRRQQTEALLPSPRIEARIVSFPHQQSTMPYAPVIRDLKWSSTGGELYFRGENSIGNHQLYVLRLNEHSVRALTPANRDVDRFDVMANTIAYTITSSRDCPARCLSSEDQPDAHRVTGQRLQDIFVSKRMKSIDPERYTLEALTDDHGRWKRKSFPAYDYLDMPYLTYVFPFMLSPSGKNLLLLVPTSNIPASWSQFQPAPDHDFLRFTENKAERTAASNLLRPRQYAVLNLATGKLRILVDGPEARSAAYTEFGHAAWSTDEQDVLVGNTFISRVSGQPESPADDLPCTVARVSLRTSQVSCILHLAANNYSVKETVAAISFMGSSDHVCVEKEDHDRTQRTNDFAFVRGAWIAGHEGGMACENKPSTTEDSLSLSVRESLNAPQTLWLQRGDRSWKVWDPNPQFKEIRFAPASEYSWKDASGYEWHGALLKPLDYVPGHRYPAVIQMYSFAKGKFLTDGTDPTAFAARELASVGFVVLQIQKKKDVLTEADPNDALQGYKSAINTLDREGLIDTKRVGAVGFSWTCWYVVHAIVQEPSLFAAATVADGFDNDYLQYLFFAEGNYQVRKQMEHIYGGPPIGDGFARWYEKAPGFHLERVEAPVRIEAINPLSVLQEWDLYALLRLQNKPVDMIYFPNGTHIHQKPMERWESQQGNIDWLRFWLQGYEDQAPAKRGEYAFWRQLRTEHEATIAKRVGSQ